MMDMWVLGALEKTPEEGRVVNGIDAMRQGAPVRMPTAT